MRTMDVRDLNEAESVERVLDACLLADTRAYIRSLEVCSVCGRVTACRQGLADYEWRCLDRVGCVLFR